jgi:hypothetical protein
MIPPTREPSSIYKWSENPWAGQLLHTIGKPSLPSTIADDALALSALLFLVCTYTIFLALRTKDQLLATRLEKPVDALFSLALTGMVAAGFIMVYTVW